MKQYYTITMEEFKEWQEELEECNSREQEYQFVIDKINKKFNIEYSYNWGYKWQEEKKYLYGTPQKILNSNLLKVDLDRWYNCGYRNSIEQNIVRLFTKMTVLLSKEYEDYFSFCSNLNIYVSMFKHERAISESELDKSIIVLQQLQQYYMNRTEKLETPKLVREAFENYTIIEKALELLKEDGCMVKY